MKIVGVHGVGNFQAGLGPTEAAEILARVWTKHLTSAFDGEPRIDTEFAYYADLLRGVAAQGVDDPEHLAPSAQEALRSWVGLLNPPEAIAMGVGTMPLRALVSWVASHFGLDRGYVSWFLSRFFSELTTYLKDADSHHRLEARARVAEAIFRAPPQVVISHSLGSVVTYEALWTQGQTAIDLWITMGSPLAMPDVVFSKLIPQAAERPPGVANWLNVADKGDLAAIPRHGVSRAFTGVTSDLRLPSTPPISISPNTTWHHQSSPAHLRHTYELGHPSLLESHWVSFLCVPLASECWLG